MRTNKLLTLTRRMKRQLPAFRAFQYKTMFAAVLFYKTNNTVLFVFQNSTVRWAFIHSYILWLILNKNTPLYINQCQLCRANVFRSGKCLLMAPGVPYFLIYICLMIIKHMIKKLKSRYRNFFLTKQSPKQKREQ